MEWYLKCLRQYADFSGRARRKEYWMFLLINMLIFIVLGFVDKAIGFTFGDSSVGVFYITYSICVTIPGLAVVVRRLHDVGRSGWWYFIVLIPLIGAIILIIWFCKEGEHGENQWGKNPKEE